MTESDAEIKIVIGRLRAWARALEQREFEVLEDVLADDYLFSCHTTLWVGTMRKRQFIDLDRHIKDCTIDFKGIWGHRMGDMVMTRALATVSETFEGDMGPGMPTAEELTNTVAGKTLAYASGWRLYDGVWRCYDHHMFGAVGSN